MDFRSCEPATPTPKYGFPPLRLGGDVFYQLAHSDQERNVGFKTTVDENVDLDIQICVKIFFFPFQEERRREPIFKCFLQGERHAGCFTYSSSVRVSETLSENTILSLQLRIWGWNNEFNSGNTGSPAPSKTSLVDCVTSSKLHCCFIRLLLSLAASSALFVSFQFHPVLNCLSPPFKPIFSTLLNRITTMFRIVSVICCCSTHLNGLV